MYDPLKESVVDRVRYLEKTIRKAKTFLESAPPGRLRCSKRKNRVAYFHMLDDASPNGIYLGRSEQKTIRSLGQKSYELGILKAAQEELVLLNEVLKFYEKGRMEELYEKLSDTRKNLVDPVKLSDMDYARAWQDTPYVQKDNRDGNHKYHTANGELVCSKSEVIIANTLHRLGVPYRYEQELYLRGLGFVHPDFRCLNVHTRKEFLWEHEGKMDDVGYASTAVQRENAYLENGYFPGIDLIMTRETLDFPLDPLQIEQLIKKFLM